MNVRGDRDHFLYLEYLRMIQNYEALKVYALSFFFFLMFEEKVFVTKYYKTNQKLDIFNYICMCMYVCI